MFDALWRRLGWPRGYEIVVLVALLAAIGVGAFGALAGQKAASIFWEELRLDNGPAWLSVIVVLVAPFVLRFGRGAFWGRTGQALCKTPWIGVGAGALLYVLLVFGGSRGVPFTPDETGAILQARTFAAGHLTPQVAPELIEWVMRRAVQDDVYLLSRRDGRYSAAYWPGFALLMAPFAFFGIEWACNPVITSLSLWLLWELGRRLCARKGQRFSDEGGVWAMVLALSAAQIALHAATYMAMPAHLLFDLWFCLGFIQGSKRSAFGAGLVGGFAVVLHNPVAHLSFALPWIVWMACRRRVLFAPLLIGYALLLLPIGLSWSAHLGTFDPGHYPGEVVAKVAAPGSRFAETLARITYAMRPPDALLLLARGAGLCKVAVWAAPGVAGLALLGWLQTRREKSKSAVEVGNTDYLWLLGVSLGCNFVIYLFARFDQGHGWGFRYLHQSWLAIAILGAAFLVRQNGLWKKTAALACASGLLLMFVRVDTMRSSLAIERPSAPQNAPSMTFIRERGVVWLDNDPFLRNSNWSLRFDSPSRNAALARRFLRDARRADGGSWGETWSGSGFLRPGSR